MNDAVNAANQLAAYLRALPDEGSRRKALSTFAAALGDALGRPVLGPIPSADGRGRDGCRRAPSDNRLQSLVWIGNELSKALTVDDLYYHAVLLARDHLGFDRIGLWLVDEDDPDYIIGTFGVDEEGEVRDERGVRLRIPEDGVIGELRRALSDAEQPRECLLQDGRGIVVGTGPRCAGGLWDGQVLRGCVFADNLFSQRAVDDHDAEVVGLFASVLGHLHARVWGQAERNQLAAAVDQTAEGIVIVDDDTGTICYANPAMRTITGYAPEDLVSRDPFIFTEPADPEQRQQIKEVLRRTGYWTGRITLRRADSTICVTDTTLSAVRSPWGASKSYVAVIRDMTAYLALEDQLVEARKMQTVGALAAGVAHDFNNLLTGILGAASMIRLSASGGDPTLRAAGLIERAARRAAHLTHQLLGFARQGKLQEIRVDMHALIGAAVGRLRGTIQPEADVRLDLAAPEPTVWGDPDQLQEVIVGLVTNAIESLSTGGCVTVRTAAELRGHGPMELPDGAIGTQDLVVIVADTGTGIPTHIRPRIFEPFFTTKAPGRRSGLGLAMIEGIVEAHFGSIQVESTVGQGTTICVRLPIAAIASAADLSSDAPRGHGRILLVDDEEACRRGGAGILRSLGYDVRTVAAGDDALAAYQQADPPFDLVVVDLAMPVASGADCCKALRRLDPTARLLVSSRHSADLSRRTMAEAALGVVSKPFQAAELAHAVARAIGGHRAADE